MGKYTLIFDNREHKLIEKFQDREIVNFSITTEALKVGDIIIKNTETDKVILIVDEGVPKWWHILTTVYSRNNKNRQTVGIYC